MEKSYCCDIKKNIETVNVNKVKYFLPESIVYTLYCTLVFPCVNYEILVWSSAELWNKLDILLIHKIQNFL